MCIFMSIYIYSFFFELLSLKSCHVVTTCVEFKVATIIKKTCVIITKKLVDTILGQFKVNALVKVPF